MRVGVVAVIALVGGCTSTSAAIRPDHKLDPGAAYLYGRFFIKSDDPGSWTGHQSIGISLGCSGYRTYTIWFSTTRDIQVMEVPPQQCAVTGSMLTDENGLVVKSARVEQADLRWQVFTAGKAYYLGDFFGRGVFSTTRIPTAIWKHWSWAMDAADDRYESTTAEFKGTFPNLASLPTEDKRLAPRQPPPKRGAVVIDDPKEPPMSPERVTRVAPFVRRTFPSPTACEAACPTGQCLPFRGEAGAAMACIIRCNTDKDCADGLACNCPNSEKPDGPDCHPIASTPQDRMARICLSVEPTGQPAANTSPASGK